MRDRTHLYLGLVLIFLLVVSAAILDYLAIWPFVGDGARNPVYVSDTNNAQSREEATEQSPTAPADFSITEALNVSYTTQVVVEDLEIPWSVVFTGPDRMLVTERTGMIRQVVNEELQPDPIYEFTELTARGEAGLMGMTLDPQYEDNNYVYVCFAITENGEMQDQVLRLTDNGNVLTDRQVIIEDIPAAQFHAGCELSFGPDDKLYITTGDATNGELAQNLDSLAGKILRINADGSVPEDNPFPGSPVWSYGHRNPQGIDWYPNTDILYITEHGPSGFDGPGGGDEINVATAGENYGWPEVSHQESAPEMIDPKVVFTPAIAPSSGEFYNSDNISDFSNNFFVAMLTGEGIMRFVMNPENPEEILMYERLPTIEEYGRIREITLGPDGHLYFATSNQDGRGNVREGDDKIVRIVPN